MNLVEKVARAIHDASNETSIAFMADLPSDTDTIRLLRVADTEKRMAQARAAIEAMKKPTEEMMQAGHDLIDNDGLGLARAYPAMIEAALRTC